MGTAPGEGNLAFFDLLPCINPHAYTGDYRQLPAPTYRIGMMVEGEGTFHLDGDTVHVGPREMVFIPAGYTYVSHWTPAPVVNFYTLYFCFNDSRFFLHRKETKLQTLVFPDPETMLADFADALDAYRSGPVGWYRTMGFFYRLLDRITPMLQVTDAAALDSRIEQAVLYIEQHYRESFSIDALADLCRMSTSHFYALFRQNMGYSPITYKQKLTVARAEMLLVAEPDKSIEEISAELGYHSSIYFREIFKKYHGITPSGYRKLRLHEM